MNKIYCFSNVVGGGEGVAYAIAEDGTVLGSHWCSYESYVPPGSRPDKHKAYKEHYPDGYEMEFVRSADFDNHKGLQEALRLYQLQGEEENKDIEVAE